MVRDEEIDSDMESSGQERPLDWPMVASAKNVESFMIVYDVDRWTVAALGQEVKLCEQSRAPDANL